jgi:hypothetical protein
VTKPSVGTKQRKDSRTLKNPIIPSPLETTLSSRLNTKKVRKPLFDGVIGLPCGIFLGQVGPLDENFDGNSIMAFDKLMIQNSSKLSTDFFGRSNVRQVLLGKYIRAQLLFQARNMEDQMDLGVRWKIEAISDRTNALQNFIGSIKTW